MPLYDYREDTEASVDTWEILDQQGPDDAGNFTVPPGAGRITRLRFGIAPDTGGAAITRFVSAFRLQGAALQTQEKPYHFVGPAGHQRIDSDGFVDLYAPPAEVPVNMPVQPGQDFEAAVKMIGEDLGDLHGHITIVYDGPTASPVLQATEVREVDLSASNTRVAIDQDIDPNQTTRDFLVPPNVSRIVAADYAVGMDLAADNATRFLHEFELDGNGLDVDVKPQRWSGWSGQAIGVTQGGDGFIANPERMLLDLPVITERGQEIQARAAMLEDDYGDSTAILGLYYA